MGDMLQSRGGQIAVLLIVATVVVSPITVAVGAVTTTTAQSPKTYSVSDNVEIWQRAPLPLRLDTADAAKTIQGGAVDISIQELSTGPVPARKSKLGIYQPDQPVTATFKSVSGAGTNTFNGNDTQVVIARLEPNSSVVDGSSTDAAMDMLPTTLDGAQELLTSENANENATFWVKNTGQITDGSISPEVQFPKAGAYVIFLATGNAFDAPETGGDLSVNGETTIVGMDAAVVESSAASVSPPSDAVAPGNNATFTIDTGPGKTNVSVLLYRTSTVANSETVVRVTEPIDSSLNASDITIEHSISELNGVARFNGPVTVFGTTFGDNRTSGSVSVAGTIERAIAEANASSDQTISEPTTEVLNPPGDTLDGSIVGLANVTGTVTVNVETLGNWSTGDYTWVVATGSSSAGTLQTATGSLTIQTPSSGGGGDEDGDFWVPPSDGDDDDEPSGPPEEPPQEPPVNTPRIDGAGPGSSVTEQAGRVNITLVSAAPNRAVQVQIPVNETEVDTGGFAVSGVNLSFTQNTSGSITVNPVTTPPAPPVSQTSDLGYFEITHTVTNENVSGATYEFVVSKQQLEARGLAPGDVALYRYEDNGWRELDTRMIGETNTTVRYEAESPGLSLYAISKQNAAKANIQVTDATLSATEVQVGDTVEVTAVIENKGSAAGEFTAELDIDGTTVASQTVELGAGEQTTITFTTSFEEAEDYTVSVSGTVAGTVSVTSQQTTQQPTTQQPTTQQPTTSTPGGPGDGDGGGGGMSPLIWFGILVLIALIGAGYYLYTQGYFEDETDQL